MKEKAREKSLRLTSAIECIPPSRPIPARLYLRASCDIRGERDLPGFSSNP